MASADYSLVTPERVSLEYGIAGIGSRGAAAIVDTAIQAVALVVVLVGLGGGAAAAGAFLPLSGGGATRAALVLGLFVLAVFLVANGYYILFEIIWSGQTPGKRLVGVRVIRESGYPIRPVDAVIRNLVRIADWLPAMYGVGVLVMLLNKRSRRLGDFASGTIVVREAPRSRISTPYGSSAAFASTSADSASASAALASTSASAGPAAANSATASPAAPPAITLSSADATLVRDFLLRRDSLHPTARTDIARRLAKALSHRYHLQEAQDPESFLERLT